jgi:hypothetical protein
VGGEHFARKAGNGERAAATQCLPRAQGERPAAATGFQRALPAIGSFCPEDENPGLEQQAQL